jgi:hypothetical protein
MPHGDPDPTDPLTLRGVEMPAEEGDVLAMARGFAEEFAASGWDEPRLLAMFQAPFYLGPHLALEQLGEARIRQIVAEAVRPWRALHEARAKQESQRRNAHA